MGANNAQTATSTATAAILLSEWIPVIGLIFGGCCSNVFALESLVREVPKCGNLITFGQFAFITLVGLPSHVHLGWVPRLKPRRVPIQRWMVMVTLYFCVSVLNNLALGYNISIPLHIVFRSSGLIANMVCGYFVMNKRYPRMQALSVVMVTIGVVMATLSSVHGTHEHGLMRDSVIGIGLLSLGVVFAALLGLYQEQTYLKYGKHWREGLFYNHMLALPMFLFFYKDIGHQIQALSQSQSVNLGELPLVGALLGENMISVPYLWISLLVNVLSQWACASGVHQMTSMSSSLTLNVVLNLRKLVSLVISVLLFQNPVTPGMMAGCMLVFAGTFAYSKFRPVVAVPKKLE
ncbi:golgi uridine diphosphate-N- acetylglucosamine transporter [Coemansia sp. RSA 1935]|nr:golgi uridine diphosphate-N- acetylglucosamine transporter [Coemansia sp. RSA 1935]KAJ2728536.1 golgi uridine diphosphate-N- acetylglucosamine transporter [Coemansia sp. D1744]